MKKYLLITGVFLCLCNLSNAWENKQTHPAITEQAVSSSAATVDDYLKTQLALSEGLSTQLHWDFPSDIEEIMTKNDKVEPTKTKTILDWLRAGSSIEDEDGRWKPIRPRHHFYDPVRNSGLDNQSDHPEWQDYACTWTGFDFTGESAFCWATEGASDKEPTVNESTWSYAREGFYLGLTAESEFYREACMAITFLDIGNILHLLEDMGVPAHTRNDFLFGHYRNAVNNGNPFETWVEKKTIANSGNSLWSGSSAVIFDKLADYWDASVEPTQPSTDSPSTSWGLSECTNYQFLSYSTIFKDNVNGTKYYFPNPDINNVTEGTAYRQWWSYKYRYLSGYGVSHLAKKRYIEKYRYSMGYYAPYPPLIEVDYTVDDDNSIYTDYAQITIPRTIDYVTGLANYFFRGKLEVEAHCTETAGVAQITITNKSKNGTVEQALKGGDFELYACCLNGDRTPIELEIDDWQNGILAYDSSLIGTFNIPSLSSPIAYYGVVYRGQIVPDDDTSHVDTDDPNAIAWGKTATRAILYFGNCSEVYENYPSYFADDLAAFRASCKNFKAGFYYVPRQWFPESCPYCCTYSIADTIPDGCDYPEEIHFETLTAIPATYSDVNNYVYELLAGATPEFLMIIHHECETMYYTEADANTWAENPLSEDEDWAWPGDGDDVKGILYDGLTDWWDNLVQNNYTTYYVLRHPDDTWLWLISDIMQQLN